MKEKRKPIEHPRLKPIKDMKPGDRLKYVVKNTLKEYNGLELGDIVTVASIAPFPDMFFAYIKTETEITGAYLDSAYFERVEKRKGWLARDKKAKWHKISIKLGEFKIMPDDSGKKGGEGK